MPVKLQNSPFGKLLTFGGISLAVIGLVAVWTSDENVPVDTSEKENTALAVPIDSQSQATSDTINEDMTRLAAQLEEVKRKIKEGNSSQPAVIKNGEIDEELLMRIVDTKVAEKLAALDNGSTNMTVNKGIDDELSGYVTFGENTTSDGTSEIDFGDTSDDVSLDGYHIGKDNSYSAESVDSGSLEWIVPVGSDDKGKDNLFSDINAAGDGLFGDNTTQNNNDKKADVIQYATLDREAVLFDALLATDMVGVVPTDGGVQSPFTFKIELGKENFATSGIHLPHLAKMRMSGYAVGEWGKSCVQGVITRATFVFEDGMISNVGASNEGGGEASKIAFVTDAYGDPCITGEKYSNLSEYASISGGLAGLGAIGSAISAQQFTTTQGTDSASQVFTGNTFKNAIGSGASTGLDAVNQAVAARYANVRDLVVAQANRVVVIHLSAQLNIDYDPNGRKVINDNFDKEVELFYEEAE